MAILVLAVVIAGVASDLTSGTFWERHALLAGPASSVIVVMLSVAVIYLDVMFPVTDDAAKQSAIRQIGSRSPLS